jgi:hypothetical protein
MTKIVIAGLIGDVATFDATLAGHPGFRTVA